MVKAYGKSSHAQTQNSWAMLLLTAQNKRLHTLS
jgi:hypothetical protein